MIGLKKEMEIKITFISGSSGSTATKTLATIKIDENTVTIEGTFRRKNNDSGLDENFTCPRRSIATQANKLSTSLNFFIENSEMDISDVLDFIRAGCDRCYSVYNLLMMHEHIQSWRTGTNKIMDIRVSLRSNRTHDIKTGTVATITVDTSTVTIKCLFKPFNNFNYSRTSINDESERLDDCLRKCMIAYSNHLDPF